MSKIELNHGGDPARKAQMAAAIRAVTERVTVSIIAGQGMLNVQGHDQQGVCRSDQDYYDNLATELVDWISSTDATLAASILATLSLPEIEAMPKAREEHLRDPEGVAAIREWRRMNLQ
jgi:hypothetical protein